MAEFKEKDRNLLNNEERENHQPAQRIPVEIRESSSSGEMQKRVIVPPPPETSGAPVAGPAAAAAPAEERAPLLIPTEANDMRSRWDSVQVAFVDEPRRAVQEAEELVSIAMSRLSEIFADERQKLERQWDRGGNVSTEELRIALRRYRSFFNRILAI